MAKPLEVIKMAVTMHELKLDPNKPSKPYANNEEQVWLKMQAEKKRKARAKKKSWLGKLLG